MKRFDPLKIRQDFPILQTSVYGKPLVYLDNGATTQKPQAVIDALRHYYEAENANIHRGVYQLSTHATEKYESARTAVRKFLNAAHDREIIFTRGTTEGINLVASSWGRANLKAGDEVVISAMEHHSNIVPWQMICEQTGAILRVIPINDSGELLMEEYAGLLKSGRVKFVSVVHLSNSLGTINDAKEIIRLGHQVGAKVLIDGAQWVAHYPTDVRDLDADFYVFSGHKLFGPTGIGALYGKTELLNAMPPYQGGGDMIASVTFAKTLYADLPNKFEAGTPNIAGAIGLAAAIEYLNTIDFHAAAQHEHELLTYATEHLTQIPGLRVIGTAVNKGSVVSFVIDDELLSSSHDVGVALDMEGVAVRTGHHCCQPVMDRMGVPATARASFAMYNTVDDVDALVNALWRISGKAHQRGPRQVTKSEIPDLKYPDPVAPSPQAAADQLAEDMEFLGDYQARTQYLLDLGEKIPAMPASLKTEATRVHGCMSVVHLQGQKRPGTKDSLDFLADSDAHLVRGLIAMMQKLFAGQRATDILAFDVEAYFRRIGLDQFITTQRRNGLAGMVKRIRALATEIASNQQ